MALYSGYVSFFLLTVGFELAISLNITLQYRISPQFLTLQYFIQCCSFQGCITSFYEWLVQALLWTVLCVTPPKKMSEESNPKTGSMGYLYSTMLRLLRCCLWRYSCFSLFPWLQCGTSYLFFVILHQWLAMVFITSVFITMLIKIFLISMRHAIENIYSSWRYEIKMLIQK